MKIGIVCYPSVGGSGVVASEVGLALARRGHEVHFISRDMPWRLDASSVRFHRVVSSTSRLSGDNYTLALAATLAEVGAQLDLIHVHYAVPHAVSALLAVQMLAAHGKKPRLVVTLHGTDVTQQDPAIAPVMRYALAQADAITVPSQFLKDAAAVDAHVIANFVDTERFAPGPAPGTVVFHASNFRAIKRLTDVIRVFAEVRKHKPATLVLAGDGDDRAAAETLAGQLGIASDVQFLGARHDMPERLKQARVFLLTSQNESFGLAALEAQSTGVPVVATAVGGVGEVVRNGETGFLHSAGDIDTMAASVLRLLGDDALHRQMSLKARENALARFSEKANVDAYETLFRSLVGVGP